VVEAAKAEGRVVVYTTIGNEETRNTLVEMFEERHPEIVVEMTRLDSGPLTARIAQELEAGAPTADAMQLVDNVIYDEHPEWFRDMRGLVPNLDEYWPDKYVAANGTYVHQQAMEFIVSFNSDKIEGDVPDTWEELSTWDGLGEAILLDPRSSGSFMGWALFIRDKLGDEVLADFGKNVGGLSDSAATAAQQVAAGEVALALPAVKELTTVMLDAGAPVVRQRTEPVIGATHIWAMPDGQDGNPNAARVWANFMLSRDAVALICQKGDNMPVAYDDIPDCPMAPEMSLVADYLPVAEDVRAEVAQTLGLE
jgi:ABC-type Fe3+ transport system substrate-binding protein